MERNTERKNVIFLTVVAIATLLVAVVGATFAFFTTTVQSNISNNQNKVDVGTAKLASSTIVFDSTGDKIDMQNAVPGASASTSFTIKNNSSDVDLSYDISWKDVTNNFNEKDADYVGEAPSTQADELKYSISCSSTNADSSQGSQADVTAPLTATAPILSNQKIKAGDTITCNVTVTFKETDSNQNYNQGRTFTGTIDVAPKASAVTESGD